MSKKRKVYSADFKGKLVLEVLEGEMTLNEIASKYEILPNNLKNWKKQFIENMSLAFDKSAVVKEYKEEIAILQKDSDRTGEPIAPLAQNLKTELNVLSTYNENIDMNLTHLEELIQRSKWIRNTLKIKKEIVDIIDREGDSIALMREYEKEKWLYLIRAKSSHKVYVPTLDKDLKQGEVADSLGKGEFVKSIEYRAKGKKQEQVEIYVNEIEVELRRDATKSIIE